MREGWAAVLLAGGRSVRMGQDKAFLEWRGRPLWKWQAELVRGSGARRWVLCCREEQGLAEEAREWSAAQGLELEVVLDPPDGKGGMLEALGRGMRRTGGGALVLNVDMPKVPVELVERLLKARKGGAGSVLMEEEGPAPFPGWYEPKMLEVIHQSGGPLRAGLAACVAGGLAAAVRLPEGMAGCLANWNRPEEVEE